MTDPRRAAAEAAVDFEVHDGMRLGLGSGTTAAAAIEALARRLADGRLAGIVGVATSDATAALARSRGVPLTTLDEHPRLDVAIDGADEIGPGLALVKGLGGALLREKVVAAAAARFVVVAASDKCVPRLLQRAPLPVEVIPMALGPVREAVAVFGCEPELRLTDGMPFRTDEGNLILDLRFSAAPIDPAGLGASIGAIPGVVGHGLFLGMADLAYIASADGAVQRLGQSFTGTL